jgi:hypothetical protein
MRFRCNVFLHKGSLDLACAVPEHYPIPSFITGEQWEYWGIRYVPISLRGWKLTAVEAGTRVDSSRLFQIPIPAERPAMPDPSAANWLARSAVSATAA